ncbi:MAG: pyruvate kinase [Halobacteriovoraceae bacterium]|nr:pyruvate kinase [Halobacteriovoraceae bacterium]|tara:strand:+ start:9102 stop:10796 length:1695 start_codon:yes stop_codon:yes gene_type:complete
MSRRAKIVATIGPSSNSIEMLEKLINAGLNVARINMSHGTHESHAEVIKKIRQASKNTGYEVAILCDLQGPKIRVDKLEKPLELKAGDKWVIGPSSVQEQYPEYKDCFIPTVYENLVKDSHDSALILFDDGLIEARAYGKDRDVLQIEITIGGTLKSNKGINLPDVNISAPSFTKKDREDLLFGLKNNVDYIALSFVRRAEDILAVKYLLHKLKKNTPIISKIEKPEAVTNINEIVEVTDCIMIARGDMGVEVGNHLVPGIQKEIITLCNERGVPVITATQMLESMTNNSRPTRAEANDVANAIWDGTDAVMLSGETASGDYPLAALQTMHNIVLEAEKKPKERPLLRHMDLKSISASLQIAASLIAEKTNARWVLSITQSGNSCLKMSRFRSQKRILGVTNSIEVMRKMCLYWGISPFYFEGDEGQLTNIETQMIDVLKEKKLVANGDKIVITRGDGKFFKQGTSNSLKVEIIKDIPREDVSAKGSDKFQEVKINNGRIILDTSICASCQNCVSVCPHNIWEVSKDDNNNTMINVTNAQNCSKDFECVDKCPTGAIEIIDTDL